MFFGMTRSKDSVESKRHGHAVCTYLELVKIDMLPL